MSLPEHLTPSNENKDFSWATIGRISLVLIFVASIVQKIYFYPQLPNVIASHFDADGEPNGFMPKSGFVLLLFSIDLLMFSMCWIIGWLATKIPQDFVNIPHRHYWLAPERVTQTRRTISGQLAWIGVATILLMMACFQMTVLANLRRVSLNGFVFWALIIAYLVFIAFTAWISFRAFRLPRDMIMQEEIGAIAKGSHDDAE